MTGADIRIECLRLAKPDVNVPDVELWIRRAQALEAYVTSAGQGLEPPKKRRGRPPKNANQDTLTPVSPSMAHVP